MYVEAESGIYEKAERREQVQALLADVREGDLVLVDKIDRWSRDPEFSYGSVRRILAARASFFAIGDDCDPGTSSGDSMLGLRVFFAREEHKRIKVRMVGTRRLLRDRGFYAEGLPPWGYRRQDVRGIDRNLLVVIEDDAERVRRAFELCVKGSPIAAIASSLGENRDRIAHALHNRIYIGEAKDSHGTWAKGPHPAIVSASLFARAREALDGRRNGARPSRETSETRDWWLRDVARCALCGAKMAAAYAGPHEARRHYFRCYARCTSRYVAVRAAERDCDPLIVGRLEELRVDLARAPEVAKVAKPRTTVEALQKKRERIADAYADGALTRDAMRAKLVALDRERDALATTAAPAIATDAQRRDALRGVDAMARAWVRVSAIKRRGIAVFLARAIGLAADVAPRAAWFSPEELAAREA